MNKVVLTGRLGQDPDTRTISTGLSIVNLSIATTERQKGKDGSWLSHAEWHKVVCFGKTAESAARYLKKGKQVAVEGKLKTEKWTDDKGVERYTTKIYATEIEFLSPKDDFLDDSSGHSAQTDPTQTQSYDSSFGPDDDIPF